MQRLHSSRVWLVGGALAALLIVALGWLVLVGPELSSASALRDETVATRQHNEVLLAQERSLQAKSARLTHYTSALSRALAELPADSGLPAFTRQLHAQARAHHVRVTSVVVGAAAPVEPATPAAAPTGAPTGAPATATDPAVATAGGLYSLQVTVRSDGSLHHQLAFLDAVRIAGPRRALVTATQVSPGTGSRSTSVDRASSFSTELTIFSAPQSAAEVGQLKRLLRGDLGD